MGLQHPIEALASALHHAALAGLPTLVCEARDMAAFFTLPSDQRKAMHVKGQYPMRMVHRRPNANECVVVAMFPQTWPSTALGFGGVGGRAVTDAYTTVVECKETPECRAWATYWDGRFAYCVRQSLATPDQLQDWMHDLLIKHELASAAEAVRKYGAEEKVSILPKIAEAAGAD